MLVDVLLFIFKEIKNGYQKGDKGGGIGCMYTYAYRNIQMKENGYVLDRELAEFQGKEPSYYQAEVYKRDWETLQMCISANNYQDDDTSELWHPKGRYFVRNYTLKKINEYRWQKIPKVYFEYLKNKGVKIYERI